MVKIDGCKGVSFNNEYYSDACRRAYKNNGIIHYKRYKKIKESRKTITNKMYESHYQSENISDISYKNNRRIKDKLIIIYQDLYGWLLDVYNSLIFS